MLQQTTASLKIPCSSTKPADIDFRGTYPLRSTSKGSFLLWHFGPQHACGWRWWEHDSHPDGAGVLWGFLLRHITRLNKRGKEQICMTPTDPSQAYFFVPSAAEYTSRHREQWQRCVVDSCSSLDRLMWGSSGHSLGGLNATKITDQHRCARTLEWRKGENAGRCVFYRCSWTDRHEFQLFGTRCTSAKQRRQRSESLKRVLRSTKVLRLCSAGRPVWRVLPQRHRQRSLGCSRSAPPGRPSQMFLVQREQQMCRDSDFKMLHKT